MWVLNILALLGAIISMVSAAAIFPARQAPAQPQCKPTTVTTTVYVPLVTTVLPPTVTVAMVDSASIAAQASSDARIDTEVVSEQSQDRPVSDQQSTGYPVHTDVLTAPAFTATEERSGSFYVVHTPSTTTWGDLPYGNHVPVGTTQVTVMPPPPANTGNAEGQDVSGTITYTVSPYPASASGTAVQASSASSYGPPPYGYDNSTSQVIGPVGSSTGSGVFTSITTHFVVTSTMSVDFNVTASTALAGYGTLVQYQPSGTASLSPRDNCGEVCVLVCYGRFGCWCNNWGGNGVTSTATCYSRTVTAVPITPSATSHLAPRQTCTLVSASGYGTWCNNYEGSTTNDYTVWDTTTTPGVPTSSQQRTTTDVTATSTLSLESSSATASPASCGQSGPFEVSFDQLPVWSPANNDTQDHPPIDLFIDHFLWGIDWTYGPPPSEPYPPHDLPYLGWYIPNLNDNGTDSPSHNTGLIPAGGSFGTGAYKSNSSFWFNANFAYAACDNQDMDPDNTCDFVATAFQYANGNDQVVATQHFSIPPCQNNSTCQLQSIKFNKLFTQLSAMSFYANVQGHIKTFYMDSLQLDWYDNNCTAGLERAGSP